jgi:hypothetical protein
MSSARLKALFSQYSDAVAVLLVEATHPELPAPVRLVSSVRDVVFEGNVFKRFPFSLSLPNDDAEAVADVKLTCANFDWEGVDGEENPVDLLRSISSGPLVRGWFSEASDPELIIAGPFEMTLRESEADLETVTLTVKWDDLLNMSACDYYLTPGTAPGAFE